MSDFAKLTLDNGHNIHMRLSLVVAAYEERASGFMRTRIDLSSGGYYHIQESVGEILELIEEDGCEELRRMQQQSKLFDDEPLPTPVSVGPLRCERCEGDRRDFKNCISVIYDGESSDWLLCRRCADELMQWIKCEIGGPITGRKRSTAQRLQRKADEHRDQEPPEEAGEPVG